MVKAEGLTKEYSSGRGRVLALSGVSFAVDKGATLAIFGNSGSGKTTLLNCLGGLERPDKGTINCGGRDITSMTGKELGLFQRKYMGFVFQQGNLLSFLSVQENIAFPLVLNGTGKGAREKRVAELLEKIGLEGAGRAMPHELSGGEAQRVSVARAIASKPLLLLADEPTASLDTRTGEKLIDLLFGLGHEEGCTVIVSTHDQGIIDLSDIAINIKDGKVFQG